MRLKLTLAALLTATAGAAAAQCSADPAAGFPVSAAMAGAAAADTVFLGEVARAAAFRWLPPSPGRARHSGWRQVTGRAQPPEPRWPDDWRPRPEHRAAIALTLHADGRASGRVATASGDREFDRSLASIWDEPMPGAPPLPRPGVDSVTVMLHLGATPDEPAATVRFAAHQAPVRLVPGTLMVSGSGESRRPQRLVVKYDVGEDGRMLPGSFQPLGAGHPPLIRAVRDGLSRASFEPAQSNCRPIRHTVLQTFGV